MSCKYDVYGSYMCYNEKIIEKADNVETTIVSQQIDPRPDLKDTWSNPEQCKTWTNIGECDKNPSFMWQNCPKSCWIKGPNLTDNDKINCPLWKDKGECAKNPGYMLKDCAASCFNVVKDKIIDCNHGLKNDQCTKNPDYMFKNCPQSCINASLQAAYTKYKK